MVDWLKCLTSAELLVVFAVIHFFFFFFTFSAHSTLNMTEYSRGVSQHPAHLLEKKNTSTNTHSHLKGITVRKALVERRLEQMYVALEVSNLARLQGSRHGLTRVTAD